VSTKEECKNTRTKEEPGPPADGQVTLDEVIEESLDTSVVQVLDAFRATVNPTISFANKTERAAARSLVKAFTLESVLKAIAFSASIRGKEYAPTIFKPSDLEKKWPNLANWKQKEQQRPPDGGQGPRSGARRLHDGTEAVMSNGRWVDANNRGVAIDLSYYPELTK